MLIIDILSYYYTYYHHNTLLLCDPVHNNMQWLEEVTQGKRKKAVIFKLFPKLDAANIALYFSK